MNIFSVFFKRSLEILHVWKSKTNLLTTCYTMWVLFWGPPEAHRSGAWSTSLMCMNGEWIKRRYNLMVVSECGASGKWSAGALFGETRECRGKALWHSVSCSFGLSLCTPAVPLTALIRCQTSKALLSEEPLKPWAEIKPSFMSSFSLGFAKRQKDNPSCTNGNQKIFWTDIKIYWIPPKWYLEKKNSQ